MDISLSRSTLLGFALRVMVTGYTRSQQIALLRLLALVTERQLPLVPMLEAFAKDMHGAQQYRVTRLVRLLESGTSLPDGLEQIPRILPDEAVLAVRFGAQCGTLAASLNGAAASLASRQDHVAESPLRGFLFYVCLLLLVFAMILTFVMIRIVPVFEQIFADYDVQLPTLTRNLIIASQFAAQYWYVIAVVILLVVVALLSDMIERSARSGAVARLLRPFLGLQSADVLRNLAIVTEAGRPLGGALSTLARYHYNAAVRQRLLYVRNEVDQGADVWQSMSQSGLIASREAAVLQASRRAGNQAWALHEMARRMSGRVEYRFGLLLQILRPMTLLCLGAVVGSVVIGLFLPLVSLIHDLSMVL